jgi:CRP/FNR family transcriptional regulator
MNASLTPLKSILEGARTKHYTQGQLLFYAGDTIVENFIVESGIVKIFDIDNKGVEKVLQIVKPPAILPFSCVAPSSESVDWYYGALTDVEVYVFPPGELIRKITTTPQLSAYIINSLVVDNYELMRRVDGMSKTDAKNKIINVLQFFSLHYAKREKQGWKRIEFPITHQLIADIAGITRESTTIQMGVLQKEKIVRTRRPYIEVNMQRMTQDL